jgi:hypothetical protein
MVRQPSLDWPCKNFRFVSDPNDHGEQMGTTRCISLTFLLLVLAQPVACQRKFVIELATGLPYNIPLPLVVHQTGAPDLRVTAHYSSEPFVVPISWVWRIGYWDGEQGWEFEAIHHKVFLDNRAQEIQEFSVSHGLNLLTINRAWRMADYLFRVGGGIALTHPENTIRGKTLPENEGIFGMGYYVSGPALNVSAGRQVSLIGNLVGLLEVKAFSSLASIPVVDGNADFYHIAFQLSLGLGYSISCD